MKTSFVVLLKCFAADRPTPGSNFPKNYFWGITMLGKLVFVQEKYIFLFKKFITLKERKHSSSVWWIEMGQFDLQHNKRQRHHVFIAKSQQTSFLISRFTHCRNMRPRKLPMPLIIENSEFFATVPKVMSRPHLQSGLLRPLHAFRDGCAARLCAWNQSVGWIVRLEPLWENELQTNISSWNSFFV